MKCHSVSTIFAIPLRVPQALHPIYIHAHKAMRSTISPQDPPPQNGGTIRRPKDTDQAHPHSLTLSLSHARTHTHKHAHKHTNTQTQKHKNTKTHKHTLSRISRMTQSLSWGNSCCVNLSRRCSRPASDGIFISWRSGFPPKTTHGQEEGTPSR